MGVEGKDKAKVLEAGAAALSNQFGPHRSEAAQRLRPFAGRSVDSVRRRQVDHFADRAQRDQSDPDHDLAARPRARRFHRVHSSRRRRRAFHRTRQSRRDADPAVRRRIVPAGGHRLAEDRRLAAMVRFSRRAGRRARVRTPINAARSSAFPSWRANSRSKSAKSRRDRPRRRDVALSLRQAAPHPQSRGRAGARDDGVHPESGGDGLTFRARRAGATRLISDMARTRRTGRFEAGTIRGDFRPRRRRNSRRRRFAPLLSALPTHDPAPGPRLRSGVDGWETIKSSRSGRTRASRFHLFDARHFDAARRTRASRIANHDRSPSE